MIDKKNACRVFESNDGKGLDKESILLLRKYLVDNRTQKQMAEEFGQSLPVIRHRLSKAVYQLRKISNDPEYLKARAILYGKD